MEGMAHSLFHHNHYKDGGSTQSLGGTCSAQLLKPLLLNLLKDL